MSRMRRPAALGVAGKVLELATLVPLLTVVPRELGPRDYGALALALSLLTIGSAAAALGGPTLMSRFVPAAPTEERASLALALTLRSAPWRVGASATVLVGVIVTATLAPDWVPPLPAALVAAALVLDVAATLLLQASLALGNVRAWILRYPLQNATLVAAVLVLHAIWGRDGALAALPISSAAALALAAATVVPRLRGVRAAPRLPSGVGRFALLQGASGALLMVTHRGGIVVLAVLGGSAAQQGYAGIALGIALAATYAVWQVFAVELPALAGLAVADLPAAERSVRRAARALAAAAAAAALAGSLAAGPLLGWVVGPAYRGADDALALALAAVALAPAAAAVNQLSALRLEPGLRLVSIAFGAAAFLVTALALVPGHAAAGASAALAAGSAASVVVGGVLLRPGVDQGLFAGSLASSAAIVVLAVAR